jgi:hypothetical protein
VVVGLVHEGEKAVLAASHLPTWPPEHTSCEEPLPMRKFVVQANGLQTPLPPLPQARPRLDHPPKSLARTGDVHTVSL